MFSKLCSIPQISFIRHLLRLSICLIFCNSVSAQTIKLAYRNYTIDDGLPSSECYEIIQDSKDYIWISTDNGVSKFDGDHFINYGPEQGLMDKTVLFMHEDHRGWIWMSTLSGNCYIYRADTIAPYEYNYILQEKRSDYGLINDFIVDNTGAVHFSLLHYAILTIAVDGKTTTWRKNLRRYQAGFYKREGKLLHLNEYNHDLAAKSVDKTVTTITINDPSVRDTLKVMIKVEGARQSSKLISYSFLLDDYIVLQNYGNIYLLDKNYQVIEVVSFTKGAINCMYKLKNGQILIGLYESQGLLLFDNMEALFRGETGEKFFEGNTISHLNQGKDGSIWIATVENGIYHIPSLEVKVYHFDLGNANFNVADASRSGTAFFGVTNGQIFQKDHLTDWQKLPRVPDLFRLDVMHYDEKRNLLLVSSPARSLRIDGESQWKKISLNDIELIFTGYVDNLENEIIGYNSSGLYSLSYEYEQPMIKYNDRLEFIKVNLVAKTHPDTMWLGGRSGLFLLNKELEIQKINDFPDLLDVNIRCLKIYQDTSLLIGTKNYGMLRLKHGKISQISKKDGLLDNTIDRIQIDQGGQIWITSKKGLNRLTYQQDSLFINTISTLNGLPSNEVIDVTFGKETNWIVGKQWITAFPRDFEFDYHPLQVNISQLLIDGKEHPLDSEITFDWNNSISLEYTAFNYHAYKNQSYRYRLQPTDEWLTTNQPFANFSNLAPDKYQFEIQTLQNDGNWSKSTPLSLRVLRPYWQRWWFISIGILLVAYLAYYLFRQRIQKLKQDRKQLELEDQINRFKQKAYQAQMNPHFVFNCLNAIQGYIIGGEQDQKKAARLLVRFSDLMRQALDASRKDSITLTDEIRLLNNYLQLEQMRFDHKFDYFIEQDPAIESDWIQVPPLLIQPYIENAVLHGVASLTSRGVIRLSYQLLDQETLEVSISDNGPGISYTKSLKKKSGNIKRESVGMSIAQERLEVLSFRSDNIKITEPKGPDGEVLGTQVTVQIPLSK